MSYGFGEFLKKKTINGWHLFSLISGSISIAMIVGMVSGELSTGEGVSSMIQLSVRFAVPWLYVAFSASSAHVLFSSDFSAWILRNRKYFGLCFAVAMAWQALFIVWMVGLYTDYYVNEVYVLRDAIEGLAGYSFLIPMTLTTFRFGRRLISRKQWRVLHKTGIYYLWAYAFSVYWWTLFYYPNPAPIDYAFYWAGFLAWGLRAAAWTKTRRKSAAKVSAERGLNRLAGPVGVVVIGAGIGAASFGSTWSEAAQELLYGYTLTRIPELYLPYWPFEPFLPLLVIGLGCYLIGKSTNWKALKMVSGA
ncbi:MAG: hypothetical protein NZ762_09765 [Dehalococcoidia bacterium]|nr:hypothetical protein [Dehalococcoidia bacterium]